MPILGKAIANYLSNLAGLYSVELPSELQNEIISLVATCNEKGLNRAIFVSGQDPSKITVASTSWAELLSWRTEDDRVFVWERGNREPDSSFQSVVKPFISSRFPGNPSGECTLDLLARLSIRQLCIAHRLEQVGNTFDAFFATARWVANVLRYAFELAGSTPSTHWSSQFLIHWARTLDLLDQGLTNLPSPSVALKPRHAWEIIRVAGLPVPAEIAGTGNPFIGPPQNDKMDDRRCQGFAEEWQKVVDDYLVNQEDRAVLLTALDLIESGAEKISSWRDLEWDTVEANVTTLATTAAPIVGQKVFISGKSPSLLTQQLPYPAPKPAWWGVTLATIKRAIDQLRDSTFFGPSNSCKALVKVAKQPNTYWLQTRAGRVTRAPTPKDWKAEVVVEDLEVLFKAPWTKLTVSYSEPSEGSDGYAWIHPDDITLNVTGREVSTIVKKPPSVISGTQLLIRFDLNIVYAATSDSKSGTLSGEWNPARTLQIGAKVRDFVDGAWKSTARNANASVQLIIPSPFSPTVLVEPEDGKPSVAPDNGDTFKANPATGETWEPKTTPDVLLKEEGRYAVSVYDGSLDLNNPSFSTQATPLVNGIPLKQLEQTSDLYYSEALGLDDSDVISVGGPGGVKDFATVKIKERSASLSSGLLSAVQGLPTGQKPPSTETQSSLPGQYQVEVTRALCNPPVGIYNSLYQYVVFTGETPLIWPQHPGTPSPKFLPDSQGNLPLPGIGNGPSTGLIGSPEWSKFMEALVQVCEAIGLKPGAENIWLSGFNPFDITGPVVKFYVETHRDLVQAAKRISLTDTFWASYPFSVVVVDGKMGPSRGQVQAVLLSPLHPARLAWAFAVAFTATYTTSRSKKASIPIGLAEGWNIPYTGATVSISGKKLPLVAIPTDPGIEQDFAAWSALVALDSNGLAQLPAIAVGLPLPWGGQTGINKKVVAQALKDYLVVHSHINSLEVDIRSISEAPRSREIDAALLQLVGGDSDIKAITNLGGGTRIWDSFYRQGLTPTRDDLFTVRRESNNTRPFEWRRYQPQNPPSTSDIAFVENSNVHLDISKGSTEGLLGLLPLKRFSPSTLKDFSLEQNYSTVPGEDLLGLASLLAEIEYGEKNSQLALQSFPRADALGIGRGARWEILGTFNIDPALLSSIVAPLCL